MNITQEQPEENKDINKRSVENFSDYLNYYFLNTFGKKILEQLDSWEISEKEKDEVRKRIKEFENKNKK